MRRRDVEPELFHQPRQAGGLAFREVEDQPRQGGGVDDRVLERAFQPAADEPRVERVVAVLDQDRALRETQEGAACILELRRSDEHGAVDVVALAGIGVDRGAAVDQGVEEGEWAIEGKTLGPDLQDQEGCVARGLDIERHELRDLERSLGSDLRRVDGDLLPRHELGRSTRLEIQPARAHRASARARFAQAISSRLIALSSRTATA